MIRNFRGLSYRKFSKDAVVAARRKRSVNRSGRRRTGCKRLHVNHASWKVSKASKSIQLALFDVGDGIDRAFLDSGARDESPQVQR